MNEIAPIVRSRIVGGSFESSRAIGYLIRQRRYMYKLLSHIPCARTIRPRTASIRYAAISDEAFPVRCSHIRSTAIQDAVPPFPEFIAKRDSGVKGRARVGIKNRPRTMSGVRFAASSLYYEADRAACADLSRILRRGGTKMAHGAILRPGNYKVPTAQLTARESFMEQSGIEELNLGPQRHIVAWGGGKPGF